MGNRTAKIIDFEQFRAARNAMDCAAPKSDSVAAPGAMFPVPFLYFFYYPYQPVVYWPANVIS